MTPTIPVGPSYVESSSPCRSPRSGSRVVTETGTGRVCGVSASNAPRQNTCWAPLERSAEVSRLPNWRQRMFGSSPWTSTRSRPPGSWAVRISVVGQVIARSPSGPVPTMGRLTWLS